MLLQKTTFERLFSAAPSGSGLLTLTSFGFESNRKRHFVVTAPGNPKLEQGMTVIALLEKPNDWSSDSFLGWVNCADGSLVCHSPSKLFGIAILNANFAIMFPARAYDVIATPSNANVFAVIIAVLFTGFTLQFLFRSAKAFLVKRTLVTVRDSFVPKAKFTASTLAERDASLDSGSRPLP